MDVLPILLSRLADTLEPYSWEQLSNRDPIGLLVLEAGDEDILSGQLKKRGWITRPSRSAYPTLAVEMMVTTRSQSQSSATVDLRTSRQISQLHSADYEALDRF